jgi:hypothetical protein
VPAKKDEKVLSKRKRVLADSKREIFPARLAGQIALPAEAFTHLLGSKLPRPHLASWSKATLRKLEAKWIIESFLKLEKWNFQDISNRFYTDKPVKVWHFLIILVSICFVKKYIVLIVCKNSKFDLFRFCTSLLYTAFKQLKM